MFFIVDACFFVMWFGPWSSCHGWGALGIAALWTAVMCACLATEVYGKGLLRFLNLAANERIRPLVVMAAVVWGLYFVGIGDGLHYLMPKTFSENGALFSPAGCGLLQTLVAIVWVVARIPFVKFVRWGVRRCNGAWKGKKSKNG